MTNAVKAQKLEFNNVISMGVSYAWENAAGGENVIACSGLSKAGSLVKRTKNVSLDVLNLDLANADDSVIDFMANNQSRYVDGHLVDIHANGVYAGNGKLTEYSIKEGSQSNAVITNLNYEMINGGPDDQENLDKEDDPVTRSESITVSRDIKAKSYTIEHTYDINYGNEFNLVTDHPSYADDPDYQSITARLALGANEANQAFKNPVDYQDYINLSGFAVGSGWNQKMLNDNCMGAFQTSSETKDYINGNYSKTLTRVIRYTGENIDDSDNNPYEIEYTMSFAPKKEQEEIFMVATMQGTITSTVGNCPNDIKPSDAAQLGYDNFVVGNNWADSPAKTKLKDWFSALSPLAGYTEPLNDIVINEKKKVCVPNVQKGSEKNNGKIEFSFEITNQANQEKTLQGHTYGVSETESVSFSKQKDCDGIEVDVTNTTVSKSVTAKSNCVPRINDQGEHSLYDTISSVPGPSAPSYSGPRPQTNSLQSSSVTVSPYQGSNSWSYTYSDAITAEDCTKRNQGKCYSFNVTTNITNPVNRMVTTNTQNGPQRQQQGQTLKRKSVSVNLVINDPKCLPTLGQIKTELLGILDSNAPNCVTTSKNWSISISKDGSPSANGSIAGIEDVP